MALNRLKTWGRERLQFADLNAEFDNIRNNALLLISPLTGDLAAGGNKITGLSAGLAGTPSLQFTGDSNTGMFSAAGDNVTLAAGGIACFSSAIESGNTVCRITSTLADTAGAQLQIYHNSPSPADNDTVGLIHFVANDDGGVSHIVGSIQCRFDDVTATTMDSVLLFNVSNNVNAADVNTSASLSSLGVWTDASAAKSKQYVGDKIDGALGKIKTLKTLGVYVGMATPAEKMPTAERHFSSTAEEFYDTFGLGIHPSKTKVPGIAAKDVAWLAIKGLLELESRVAVLEGGK